MYMSAINAEALLVHKNLKFYDEVVIQLDSDS